VNKKRLCHVEKFYRERVRVKGFLILLVTLCASVAAAQLKRYEDAMKRWSDLK
jgi:hypothetical protein